MGSGWAGDCVLVMSAGRASYGVLMAIQHRGRGCLTDDVAGPHGTHMRTADISLVSMLGQVSIHPVSCMNGMGHGCASIPIPSRVRSDRVPLEAMTSQSSFPDIEVTRDELHIMLVVEDSTNGRTVVHWKAGIGLTLSVERSVNSLRLQHVVSVFSSTRQTGALVGGCDPILSSGGLLDVVGIILRRLAIGGRRILEILATVTFRWHRNGDAKNGVEADKESNADKRPAQVKHHDEVCEGESD